MVIYYFAYSLYASEIYFDLDKVGCAKGMNNYDLCLLTKQVVVGDSTGMVQMFGVKKNEPQVFCYKYYQYVI